MDKPYFITAFVLSFLLLSACKHAEKPKAIRDIPLTNNKNKIIVNIATDGWYIGNKPVDSTLLHSILSEEITSRISNTDTPLVVINADTTVPFGKVVTVMRIVRNLGARTVLMVDKTGVQ